MNFFFNLNLEMFKINAFVKNQLIRNSSFKNYSQLNETIIGSIKSIYGKDNLSISNSVRQHHAKDESLHSEALPDVVVYPENVDQIKKLLNICNSNKIPVIAFGAGSGFEGGVNAVQGDCNLFLDCY